MAVHLSPRFSQTLPLNQMLTDKPWIVGIALMQDGDKTSFSTTFRNTIAESYHAFVETHNFIFDRSFYATKTTLEVALSLDHPLGAATLNGQLDDSDVSDTVH